MRRSDFYKGKTVSVVIGAKTGSLALAAQIVSQHLGRYIPGNPTVIFRQMPGGAHLGATGYIYNVAEPDGLTILAANPGVAMAELAGPAASALRHPEIRMAGLLGLGRIAVLDPRRPALQDLQGVQGFRAAS